MTYVQLEVDYSSKKGGFKETLVEARLCDRNSDFGKNAYTLRRYD